MPDWTVNFSADCPHIAGQGYRCMICDADATGHATVGGGTYDGRCLAIVCPRHASPEGWAEFKRRVARWLLDSQLEADGGPGPDGAPEVWHTDHWDPMPEHAEEVTQ
jgi:hypothetical protein